jgi:beta-lactam-binding protein with PASTA domain
VIRQLPPEGATVKCGSRVDVWIAVPLKLKPDPPKPDPPRPAPVTIVVPRLEGRDQMAATRMLEAVGLRIGEVERRPSDGPPDTVVGQSPVAGTPVQPGAPVQIWLAVPPPATVPLLRGRDRAGAAEALTSARLVLGEIGERPSDAPSGTVVGQSPSAGTVVKPGMSVQVWLAVPMSIDVPVLVGRREADAAALLRDRRLRVGEIRFRESIEPRGVVLDQAPQAGRRVDADSTVDLWVATPRRTLVPDVRGRSQRAAADALRQAGLVVGDVRERESKASRGTVSDQQPAPGAQVDAGTAVSLSIASPVFVAPTPRPPPVQPSNPAVVRVPEESTAPALSVPPAKTVAPVVPPDPVQTFITERMQPASAAFFAPSPMQRDEPSEVFLDIAPPTISPAELAMELSIAAGEKLKSTGVSAPRSTTQGVTASGPIRAAPRMVANLTADRACTITAKDPLDRAVASGERVRWRWIVTPKVVGTINLTATLNAPVILDNKETSYSIRSFDETVTVTVTTQQRANDALEWAKNHWVMLVFAGGALLGLLRWLSSYIRKPTPPAPPKPLPE